jgi:signal transduction histidine kinase
MQARYLFLFRLVLVATLALYVGHASEVRGGGVIWLCVGIYAAAAALLRWLGKRRRFTELSLLFSFLLDIAATSVILYLTEGFQSEFYVAYFLVILSTCFLEKLEFSFIVGMVACVVYSSFAFPGWDRLEPLYFLRTSLLLVTAMFSTYVADRARRLERDAEERYAAELAWMKRLSTVGRAMAALLHEVKTPLSTILLGVQRAEDLGRKRKPVVGSLKSIAREARRTLGILSDYLDFVRPKELALKPLDLDKTLARSLDAVRLHVKNRGVSIEVGPAAPARVRGSERHLIQAFTNVMLNAVAAMPMGGVLRVDRTAKDGRVSVVFSDNGIGIPPEALTRLFEPFFTTKGEAGNGLGLTIVRWIVEKHGGKLSVVSEGTGKGTTVAIELPLEAQ